MLGRRSNVEVMQHVEGVSSCIFLIERITNYLKEND